MLSPIGGSPVAPQIVGVMEREKGMFVTDCLVESVVDSCVHIMYYIIVYIAHSLFGTFANINIFAWVRSGKISIIPVYSTVLWYVYITLFPISVSEIGNKQQVRHVFYQNNLKHFLKYYNLTVAPAAQSFINVLTGISSQHLRYGMLVLF